MMGFKQLFNIDPTNNYSRAWRVPGNDHFLFTITPAYGPDFFTPTPELFDHPTRCPDGTELRECR